MESEQNLIFLVLQIVFSSVFTLVIKFAQGRQKEDVVTIGCVNYLTGAVLALPFWLSRGETGATAEQLNGAVVTGGIMGAVYFIAFFFAITLIRWIGASTASAVSVLSILLPIGFAAFYWGDQPSTLQVVGICLALTALFLMSGSRQKNSVDPSKLASADSKGSYSSPTKSMPAWVPVVIIIVFFLLCGLSRIAQEAFNKVSVPGEKPTYVLVAFVVSGIPSLCYLGYQFFVQRKKFLATEFGLGFLLGLSNALQVQFILQCLEYFPGFFVFPMTSAGSVMFTMMIAVGFMGERLNTRSYVGVGITVVSLFMLY